MYECDFKLGSCMYAFVTEHCTGLIMVCIFVFNYFVSSYCELVSCSTEIIGHFSCSPMPIKQYSPPHIQTHRKYSVVLRLYMTFHVKTVQLFFSFLPVNVHPSVKRSIFCMCMLKG